MLNVGDGMDLFFEKNGYRILIAVLLKLLAFIERNPNNLFDLGDIHGCSHCNNKDEVDQKHLFLIMKLLKCSSFLGQKLSYLFLDFEMQLYMTRTLQLDLHFGQKLWQKIHFLGKIWNPMHIV